MRLLKHYTPGPWTPGNYVATETMIQRLREEVQAAVVQDLDGTGTGQGMLVAFTGDFKDPQSRADALLMSRAPLLLEALFSLLIRIREVGLYPMVAPEVKKALEAIAPFIDPASVKEDIAAARKRNVDEWNATAPIGTPTIEEIGEDILPESLINAAGFQSVKSEVEILGRPGGDTIDDFPRKQDPAPRLVFGKLCKCKEGPTVKHDLPGKPDYCAECGEDL